MLTLENVQSVRRAPVGSVCPHCKQNIEKDTQCNKAVAVDNGAGSTDVYMHLECQKAWAEYAKLTTALFPQSDFGWLRDAPEIFNQWLLASHPRVYERLNGKIDAPMEPEVSQTALIAAQDIKKGSVIGIYRPQEAGWVHQGGKWLAPDGIVVERAGDIPFVCAPIERLAS
jgi:hypothetical protein